MTYRLMVVDDEANILNAIKRVFSREDDLDVEYFSSPEEALQRTNQVGFDLFIADYRMPKMDGIAFLSAVKQLRPDAVRLILSGQADLHALIDAINRAEVYRYISKPWDPIELVLSIRQALAHNAVMLENRRLADQVRTQQDELVRRKLVLDALELQHPDLVKVAWDKNGAVIVGDDVLDTAEYRSFSDFTKSKD